MTASLLKVTKLLGRQAAAEERKREKNNRRKLDCPCWQGSAMTREGHELLSTPFFKRCNTQDVVQTKDRSRRLLKIWESGNCLGTKNSH